MKLQNSAIASCLHSAAAALAVLFLVCWTEQVVSKPVHLSPPLKDSKMHKDVMEVSHEAQRKELEEDTSIRLMPRVNRTQNHMEICCLHANILNFYLNNILHKYSSEHPNMDRLKTNLNRVSEDLQTQGCNLTHYHDHRHTVEFRRKLERMEDQRGINKAVGETYILFTYIHDYCMEPKAATDVSKN
ncbi:interleukin-22 [Cyprinodon tularosa]|uniref:interleukin-22 n=1 Tax=Cyprinodon tularosa TaxID=77115 RepID=UPI0018E1E7D7|nr:interleukin-22 [Cyprinodon tularosa]